MRSLGAKEIVDRATLVEGKTRPLESPVWAGAIDCVGSTTLASVLSRIQPGGVVREVTVGSKAGGEVKDVTHMEIKALRKGLIARRTKAVHGAVEERNAIE